MSKQAGQGDRTRFMPMHELLALPSPDFHEDTGRALKNPPTVKSRFPQIERDIARSPGYYGELEESMRTRGQTAPVSIDTTQYDDGRPTLGGGHHRIYFAHKLGWPGMHVIDDPESGIESHEDEDVEWNRAHPFYSGRRREAALDSSNNYSSEQWRKLPKHRKGQVLADESREGMEPGLAARGHDMEWQHGEGWGKKGRYQYWEGNCRHCGGNVTVGGSGSSSNSTGRCARDEDCAGPGTKWQNDLIIEHRRNKIGDAVRQYGQDVKAEYDKQWLRGQGLEPEHDSGLTAADREFLRQHRIEGVHKAAVIAHFEAAAGPLGGCKEEWQPGERPYFEYHCLESDDSNDAALWHRSHQQVEVLHRHPRENTGGWEGSTFAERTDEGAHDMYHIRFGDGHEGDVFEDELVHHPRHFYRPDPPPMPKQAAAQSGLEYHHLLQGRKMAHPFQSVMAADNGTVVGHLSWGPGNSDVQSLWVHPDYRRRGIATALWGHAQALDKPPQHSLDRSDAGDAWARSVTPGVPDRKYSTSADEELERRGQASANVLTGRLQKGDDRHITRIAATAPRFIDEENGPFYHGTTHDHQPGDLLTGEEAAKHRNYPHVDRLPKWQSRTGKPLYMSANPGQAAWFATSMNGHEGRSRVYEVEPTGPHMHDPENLGAGSEAGRMRQAGSRITDHPLRVVREVPEWSQDKLPVSEHHYLGSPRGWYPDWDFEPEDYQRFKAHRAQPHEAAARPRIPRGNEACGCCSGTGEHADGHECYRCDASGYVPTGSREPYCPGQNEPKRRHWREGAAVPAAERTESVRHILDHYQPTDFDTWDEVRDNTDWTHPRMRAFVEDVQTGGVERPIPIDYTQNPPRVMNGHTRILAAEKAGIETVPARQHHGFMDPDDPDPQGCHSSIEEHEQASPHWQHEAAADHIVLYHGTSRENADKIAGSGLEAPEGLYTPGWPVATVNRQTADAYATRGSEHATVEIHVPKDRAKEHLWPAQDHMGGAAYGLRKPLPAEFVHAVHPVTERPEYPAETFGSEHDESGWRSREAMAEDTSYRGRWTAPGGPDDDVAAPMHDVENVLPDVYDKPHLYTHEPRRDADAIRQLRRARGNPETEVDIYRAVPHGVTSINRGDWVSNSAGYARMHAESEGYPEVWPVLHARAKAKHLFSEGYLTEWGYHGPDIEHAEIHHPGQRQAAKAPEEKPRYYELDCGHTQSNLYPLKKGTEVHCHATEGYGHLGKVVRQLRKPPKEAARELDPGEAYAAVAQEPEEEPAKFDHNDWESAQWPDRLRMLRYRKRKEPQIHRGIAVELPPEIHDFVHDQFQTRDRQAQAIADHLRSTGLGMHWSTGEETPRHFANYEQKKRPGTTKVILHAKVPEVEHIETDKEKLNDNGVLSYDGLFSSEKEIPLKHDAPVRLTGVTWYGYRNKKRFGYTHSWGEPHTAGKIEVVAHFEGDHPESMSVQDLLGLHSSEALRRERHRTGEPVGHSDATKVHTLYDRKAAEMAQNEPAWSQLDEPIRNGTIDPVLLETSSDGHTVVTEGQHRIIRAHQLGVTHLPVSYDPGSQAHRYEWDDPEPLEPKEAASPDEYRIRHRPTENGAPMHDLTGDAPDADFDKTSYNATDYLTAPPRYYSDTGENNNPEDREAIAQMKRVQGKPDALVDIYRATHKDAPHEINTGDWVTLSKGYAEKHAYAESGSDDPEAQYRVHHARVPAKHVRDGGGGGYREQGYWGPSTGCCDHHRSEVIAHFGEDMPADPEIPYMKPPGAGAETADHILQYHTGLDRGHPTNLSREDVALHGDDKHWQRWHDAEHRYRVHQDHQHLGPVGTPGEQHWPDTFALHETYLWPMSDRPAGWHPESHGGFHPLAPAEGALLTHFEAGSHPGGISHEELDARLEDWFHPQKLEAAEVRHPVSGYNIKTGKELRVSRPPEGPPGPQGLGPEGPAEFDVYHHPGLDRSQGMFERKIGTEPIQHVYRGVSADDWQQAQERGYLSSDQRGTISPAEGTNAAADPRSAVSYLPGQGAGHVVKIRVHPDEHWFTIRSDNYLRTRHQIPLSRVEGVSPQITKGGKYNWITDIGPEQHTAAVVAHFEDDDEWERRVIPPYAGQPLFHGTRSILQPGEEITPEGAKSHPNNPDIHAEPFVHATTSGAEAHEWGGRASSASADARMHELGRQQPVREGYNSDHAYPPRVYLMHPTGPVEPDPHKEGASYRSAAPMRVIREVRPLSCYAEECGNAEHWPDHPHYEFLRQEQEEDEDSGEGEHYGSLQAEAIVTFAALENPHTHGQEWYHGSPWKFSDFGADRPMSGLEFESEPEDEDHWNVALGHHFAASHGVAEQFASGEHSGGDMPAEGPSHNIIHARLEMRNPKVYHSERDMDQEVYEHEWRAGNHHDDYHDAEEKEIGREFGWDELPGTYHYRDHGDRLRRLDEPDERYLQQHRGRSWRPYATGWLSSHPDKYDIAQRFRKRLIDAGHDGIIYGNEHEKSREGETGDRVAIPFHEHQIDVTQRHGDQGCHPPEEAARGWPGQGHPTLPFHEAVVVTHFAATDWSRLYDKIPDEIHRGLFAPESHHVFSMPASDEDIAHMLIDAHQREQFPYDRDQHEKFGTHWTASEDVARDFAHEHEREHAADDQDPEHDHEEHFDAVPVVFHARKPEPHEIEDDPRRLGWQSVNDHVEHEGEREVPIKHGAPVTITGVSWLKRTGLGPMWHRHDLREPRTLRAEDRDSPEDENEWNGPRPEPEVVHHFAAAIAPMNQQLKMFHVPHERQPCPECGWKLGGGEEDALKHIRHVKGDEYEPAECEHCGHDLNLPREHAEKHHDWLTSQDWYTDWNEEGPGDTIHRGVGADLPDHVHAVVHDPSRPVHERAQALMGHLLSEHNVGGAGVGNFWSGDPDVSKTYAESYRRRFNQHNEMTPVMLHAHTPDIEHFETDPDTLRDWGVYSYHNAGNREVPLQNQAPVRIKGISWAPPGHRDREHSEWEDQGKPGLHHLDQDPAWVHHEVPGEGIRAHATVIGAEAQERTDADLTAHFAAASTPEIVITAAEGPFYHGSRSQFQPGDMLTVKGANQHAPNYSESTGRHLFFTDSVHTALDYAEPRHDSRTEVGHIYEVRPTSRYHSDPAESLGYSRDPSAYRTDRRLRVVRELGPEDMSPEHWARLRVNELHPNRTDSYNGYHWCDNCTPGGARGIPHDEAYSKTAAVTAHVGGLQEPYVAPPQAGDESLQHLVDMHGVNRPEGKAPAEAFMTALHDRFHSGQTADNRVIQHHHREPAAGAPPSRDDLISHFFTPAPAQKPVPVKHEPERLDDREYSLSDVSRRYDWEGFGKHEIEHLVHRPEHATFTREDVPVHSLRQWAPGGKLKKPITYKGIARQGKDERDRLDEVERGMDQGGTPPIVVVRDGEHHIIADGSHRSAIAAERGHSHIEAFVTERTRYPEQRTAAAGPPSFTWEYETYGPQGGYVTKHETVEGPFYHGGRANLRPGGMIKPGQKPNSWGDTFDERGRSIHTYFAHEPETAASYARETGGHMYEVEPTGKVTYDGSGGDGSWRSEHPLRVIRKIPPAEWDMLPSGRIRREASIPPPPAEMVVASKVADKALPAPARSEIAAFWGTQEDPDARGILEGLPGYFRDVAGALDALVARFGDTPAHPELAGLISDMAGAFRGAEEDAADMAARLPAAPEGVCRAPSATVPKA